MYLDGARIERREFFMNSFIFAYTIVEVGIHENK